MLRSFLTWFSLLMMATALAACCGSTACECDDLYADAIGLRFSPDSVGANPKGFLARQVDTVYLVRMARDTAQRPRTDTVQLIRPKALAIAQPLIINNTTPFSQAGNRRLDRYAYQLYLSSARRGRPHSFDLIIDSVQLNTEYRAEGCCTCYENKGKRVFIKGNSSPSDLTDQTSTNKLVPLLVERK